MELAACEKPHVSKPETWGAALFVLARLLLRSGFGLRGGQLRDNGAVLRDERGCGGASGAEHAAGNDAENQCGTCRQEHSEEQRHAGAGNRLNQRAFRRTRVHRGKQAQVVEGRQCRS